MTDAGPLADGGPLADVGPLAEAGPLTAATFDIELPSWLRRSALQRYWSRDPNSRSEQVAGDTFTWAVNFADRPTLITLEWRQPRGLCRVQQAGELADRALEQARDLVSLLLGLHLDPRPFEVLARSTPYAEIVARRPGLTIPRTASVFDALVWVIAGQQVSLHAAFSIKRRLAERFGRPIGDLLAPPTPADVASAGVDELFRHGLTRRKSEYLWQLAVSALGDGDVPLDLEGLHSVPPAELETTLLARRGLGRWSVNYLMMRAFGLPDCVPIGDVALLRALVLARGLSQRPDADGTLELMAPLAPFRSLATFHLWAWLQDAKS